MLGTAMRSILMKTNHQVMATDIALEEGIESMDIRNYSDIEKTVDRFNPEYIFHFAAETNVDKCEQEYEHAYMTNSSGTENIAMVCRNHSLKMIYISTGQVFDGKKREPYTEYDTPNPLNHYSRAKYEGEKIVERLVTDYYIFRAGWMIGGGAKDKKFVAKLIDLMKINPEVRVVHDKQGSPTFTFDFAAKILDVIATGRTGLYHLVNKGVATRYEIALEIKKILGLDCKIIPVTSAFFPLPADRPDSEAMENLKLKMFGMDTMPKWQQSMKIYLESNFK